MVTSNAFQDTINGGTEVLYIMISTMLYTVCLGQRDTQVRTSAHDKRALEQLTLNVHVKPL